MKKGQITTYIILGVVVLIIIAGGLFYASTQTKEELNIEKTSNTGSVKEFITNCIDQVGTKGVFFIAKRGGYYDKVLEGYTRDEILIPYYYKNGVTNFPELSVVESELGIYVEKQLDSCLLGFGSYKNQGYDIETEEIVAETKINENDVLVTINMPTTIIRGEETTELDSFSNTINFNLHEKYTWAEEIIIEQESNNNFFPLGYITKLAEHNKFTYLINYVGDDSIILDITPIDKYKGEQFTYTFALKYDWSEISGQLEEIDVEVE
jgi:hypothetical protein